jgi:ubiquitin-conjugating enzyme (huntingtin interacting protein 2)
MAAGGLRTRELKRLEKELEDVRALGENSSVSAEAVEDLTHWKGYLKGPVGTPYEGGHFVLDISIPTEYPYSPPKVKFDTKIWHPNISSQTGAICLDVLGKEWSPALTIRTALLSIQALLSAPEPSDPQDAEVAEMYKTKPDEFTQTAKYWTETFAKSNQGESDEKVSQIVEMGFTADAARKALMANGWDETLALNSLLGG